MDSNAPITFLSNDELSRDTARALAANAEGPVVITDGGAPSHVLLRYNRYLTWSGNDFTIVDMLGMRDGAGIVFDPPLAFGRETLEDLLARLTSENRHPPRARRARCRV